MNRFLLLIAFLILISPDFASAQKPSIFYITLSPNSPINPPNRTFFVDTLVDVRADTSARIGTWQRPSGKIVELQLKGGFEPAITDFVYQSMPNIDDKFQPYTLLVRSFDISSQPDETRFELGLTFSQRSSTHQLVPVYQADVIIESSKLFADVVKQGMAKAFLKFNEYLANPTTTSAAYSDFELESIKAAQELNLTKVIYDSSRTDEDDLLRCKQLRSGVYQTFSELRKNQPSLEGSLLIQEKNDFATLRKPAGQRAKNRFFAFYTGKNLFISTGLYQTSGFIRRYAKVQSIGRYLLWIDNYLTTSEMLANAAGASFGLIGALAASSTNSYKDCIALDMQTGGVFLVTKDKLPQLLSGHDDLLAELEVMAGKKDEQQQLRLLSKLNERVSRAR